MKVLITGSRDFKDKKFLFRELDRIHLKKEITFIIHGNAKGVDKFAEEWAKWNGIKFKAFKADWGKYGKAAGPIRNIEMLDLNPDLVIAFPISESKGTRHTISNALERKIEVRTIE